jgi:hypothetical protein
VAYDRRRTIQLAITRIISDGVTKAAACRALGVNPRTVSRWIARDPVFAERYRLARIEQAHALADRALDIADEPIARGDVASLQRNRLRVDTIKWLASKIAPRVYGDRPADVAEPSAIVVLRSTLRQ